MNRLILVIVALMAGTLLAIWLTPVYQHLKIDHAALHELAAIELARQQAQQPKPAAAIFEPSPPLTSSQK